MYLFKTENRRSTRLGRIEFEFVAIPHLIGKATQVSQAIHIFTPLLRGIETFGPRTLLEIVEIPLFEK